MVHKGRERCHACSFGVAEYGTGMTKRKDPKLHKPRRSLENTDPEKFADFLVGFAEDPECNLAKLAKRCGVPKGSVDALVRRIESRYLTVLDETKKVTTKLLLEKMDVALPLLLDKLSDKELINNSALREIAVSVGVLLEKRQLLRGEPTQIMTLAERKSMGELAPAIVAELEKRGETIDVEFEDIPPEGPPDPGVTTWAARQQAKREDRGRV